MIQGSKAVVIGWTLFGKNLPFYCQIGPLVPGLRANPRALQEENFGKRSETG